MSSPESDPVQHAYKEIPERWYEKIGPYYPYLGSACTLGGYFAYNHFIGVVSPETIAVGSGLLLTSIIADRISTVRAMDAYNRAVASGIKFKAGESNILLGHVKTSAQFMRDPMSYVIELGTLGLSSLNLGVAVTWSVYKGVAVLNNLRGAQRFDRMGQIANLEK